MNKVDCLSKAKQNKGTLYMLKHNELGEVTPLKLKVSMKTKFWFGPIKSLLGRNENNDGVMHTSPN